MLSRSKKQSKSKKSFKSKKLSKSRKPFRSNSLRVMLLSLRCKFWPVAIS